MMPPDQRLFEADLGSAEFLVGASKGLWGHAEAGALPPGAAWPMVYLWMTAAARAGAPDKFYLVLDAAGYRSAPPTGTFWDPSAKTALGFDKRPKGKPGSRFAKVFRTDWEGGRAFYHPYDRVTIESHPNWRNEQPHLVWTSAHTIVDYLEEFQALLTGEDYLGV